LRSAAQGLQILAEFAWQPSEALQQSQWRELLAIKIKLPKKASQYVEPEAAFGSVLGQWISQGWKSEFVQMTEQELCQMLQDSDPEQAVAALAALTKKGTARKEIMQQANSHRHWLVRLASMALCEIDPTQVFWQLPVKGDGGEIWLQKMAPLASEWRLQQARAIAITPDQLDALKQGAEQLSDSDQRKAWGHLLYVLAPARLALDIDEFVSRTVEIEATAIEIEG